MIEVPAAAEVVAVAAAEAEAAAVVAAAVLVAVAAVAPAAAAAIAAAAIAAAAAAAVVEFDDVSDPLHEFCIPLHDDFDVNDLALLEHVVTYLVDDLEVLILVFDDCCCFLLLKNQRLLAHHHVLVHQLHVFDRHHRHVLEFVVVPLFLNLDVIQLQQHWFFVLHV